MNSWSRPRKAIETTWPQKDIADFKEAWNGGAKRKAIAERFDVSQSCVTRISARMQLGERKGGRPRKHKGGA